MPGTCILGAGITGLTIAWQQSQRGEACTVLESAPVVGGALRSVKKDGFLAEEGPHSIQIDSPEIETFFKHIPGLNESLIEVGPQSKKRYIVRERNLVSVPGHPLQAMTTALWSPAGKLRALAEPFIRPHPPEKEESVAAFVRRRLGEDIYQYGINPLVGGIYAGDPECLSLKHAFPKLQAMEQKYGSLFRGVLTGRKTGQRSAKRIVSFRDGIATLPHCIARSLPGAVQTGVSIDSIHQADEVWEVSWSGQKKVFDRLIVTVPAHALGGLPFEETLAHRLSSLEMIQYPAVSVISLGFKRNQIRHPLDGFGVLLPECEGGNLLGVLFPSSVFTGRAPEDSVLLTVFAGGTRHPDRVTAETEKLLGIILPELQTLLGVHGEPSFIHHKHWEKAIPQYNIGYATILEAIQSIEQAYSGLQLRGNYRDGISLTDSLKAGLSLS